MICFAVYVRVHTIPKARKRVLYNLDSSSGEGDDPNENVINADKEQNRRVIKYIGRLGFSTI